MKKFLLSSLGIILIILNFVSSKSPIPNLSFENTSSLVWAGIALIVALVLIILYWILQSRYSGFD